jgi:diguanylate cyclase (GGDEF)-like protein
MIDIDHFKHVNDTYGHAAGDQVLKQFAFILSQTMRDSDTVVRWGGEEFFVVAKHTSREDSRLVAERIRARVEAFPFELGNGQVIHKTCSIGYSSFPFFRTDPSKVAWEKVAEVADQCLYTAKGMGRNTWVGVHEAGEDTEAYKDAIGAYPDVAALVAKGILRAETLGNREITWA